VSAALDRHSIHEDGDFDRMFADAGECYESVRALLTAEQPPTALIVGIHQFVPAALHAIHDAGVRIPEDVSLVVFGDSDWARATLPSLNAIVVDQAQHAAGAIELLLQSIKGDSSASRFGQNRPTSPALPGPANGTIRKEGFILMASPLHTHVAEMFGIKYPIFAFGHHEDIVVEACKAGAIGVYGGTRQTPAEIRATLKSIRARVGDLPFGIDLVIPRGMPEHNNREEIEAQLPTEHRTFVDHIYEKYGVGRPKRAGARSRFVRSEESAMQQVEAVMESDVNLLALGIGTPKDVVQRAQADGKKVASLVGSARNARYALDAGVDIIVTGLRRLVAPASSAPSACPRIVEMAATSRVAAGGVATGRHMLGEAMGAWASGWHHR
jgi:hypothetical protein